MWLIRSAFPYGWNESRKFCVMSSPCRHFNTVFPVDETIGRRTTAEQNCTLYIFQVII